MKMNKFTKTILISLITIFSASLLFVSSAQAVDPLLKVDFENTPLFSEANFLPGESVTRYADVTNNSVEIKKIGLNVIDNSGCSTDCLSDVLNLVVSENGTTLYSGSLANFYGAGEKVLSDLNTGATTKYYFSMTFSPAAGNTYQNSTANFDVKILFFGEESIGPEIPGGGGGVVIISGLEIYNEMANNIQANSVTITWDTNKQSTSRVIYSPYNVPHVLNPNNPPNYDYLYSTPEYDTPANPYGVTGSHTVHITGLSPGTTYYYRCVSHASPDTVSVGHSFTTKGVAGTETEEEDEAPGEAPGEWTGPGGETIPPTGGTEPTVEGTTTEEKEEPIVVLIPEVITSFFPSLLADIGDIFGGLGSTCYPCFSWWVILILAVCLLIESALSKKRERRRAKKWFIWSLALIFLSIIFYLTNYHCVAIWIYLALALSTLLFWRFVDPKGKKDSFIVGLFIILILFIIWLILKCLYIWIILIAILIYLFIADFLKKKKKREQMSVGI